MKSKYGHQLTEQCFPASRSFLRPFSPTCLPFYRETYMFCVISVQLPWASSNSPRKAMPSIGSQPNRNKLSSHQMDSECWSYVCRWVLHCIVFRLGCTTDLLMVGKLKKSYRNFKNVVHSPICLDAYLPLKKWSNHSKYVKPQMFRFPELVHCI